MNATAPARQPATRVSHALGYIAAAAVLIRAGSAVYQGDAVAALPGVHDQISYDALARRVLGGEGFTFATDWWPATRAGEPTAHWSFLYTLYLSAVYWLFGPHPLAARLVQAVICGVLQPWLTYRIAQRIFGPRTGRIAAIVAAVYAYFVLYGGSLMTESFFILSVLWVLDLAMRVKERDGAGTGAPWVQLGLALAAAVLLRQVFLAFVPVLYGWLAWSSPRLRLRALGGMLISTALLGALVLPWTLRNYRAFGGLVPLNTNAGYVMFWANHPVHGRNFIPILPSAVYRELIPAHLMALDEAALDRELLYLGLAEIGREPWRFLALSAGRAREYFKFWPSPDSGMASNLARPLSFGLLLPLAMLGLWGRGAKAGGPAGVLLLFVTTYTLVHLLTWSLIRYRLPVDAVLVVFGAAGIAILLERMRLAKRRLL